MQAGWGSDISRATLGGGGAGGKLCNAQARVSDTVQRAQPLDPSMKVVKFFSNDRVK